MNRSADRSAEPTFRLSGDEREVQLRERRRAQKLGYAFITLLRNEDKTTDWAELEVRIKDSTRWRDRWVWIQPHRDKEIKGELDKIRAQIAGDYLLDLAAKGELQKTFTWFTVAAEQNDFVEAWLFDRDILKADGWDQIPETTDVWGRATAAAVGDNG